MRSSEWVSSKLLVTSHCCVYVCVYGCADVCHWSTNMWAIRASMWMSPLRLAAQDLWGSHPAHCVSHVPPFETLMAPVECVTEWVGDNGAGPAASCVLRLPLVPLASKHQGEDNTLHVLFLNSLLWPYVLQSCHLIYLPMYDLYCSSAVVRLAEPFRVHTFQFWTVQLRVGWIWLLILLSQDTFDLTALRMRLVFFHISVWLCKCQHGI